MSAAASPDTTETSEGFSFCPYCGERIPSGARKCRYCLSWIGNDEAGVAISPTTGESALSPIRVERTWSLVGPGRRSAAALIDVALMVVAFFPVNLVISGMLVAIAEPETSSGPTSVWATPVPYYFILGVLVWIMYPALTEGLWGATVGKMALGLQVIREDGSPAGFGAAFVRALLRLVDGILIGCLPALILIAITDKKQRLGDLAAHTLVINHQATEASQIARF